jgi:hypothetical protein
MTLTLDEIKELIKNKTKQEWTGSVNYPFYGTVHKPSASLSKHDGTRPEYWTIPDVMFVLAMANGGAEFLVSEIERLQKYIGERALKDEQS